MKNLLYVISPADANPAGIWRIHKEVELTGHVLDSLTLSLPVRLLLHVPKKWECLMRYFGAAASTERRGATVPVDPPRGRARRFPPCQSSGAAPPPHERSANPVPPVTGPSSTR